MKEFYDKYVETFMKYYDGYQYEDFKDLVNSLEGFDLNSIEFDIDAIENSGLVFALMDEIIAGIVYDKVVLEDVDVEGKEVSVQAFDKDALIEVRDFLASKDWEISNFDTEMESLQEEEDFENREADRNKLLAELKTYDLEDLQELITYHKTMHGN